MTGIRDIRVPLDVTEARFETLIMRAAMLEGWRRHHGRKAQSAKGWRTPVAGEIGFPDLVLARAGSLIIAELKTESTSPSDDQRAWLTALSGLDPADRWASRRDLPTGISPAGYDDGTIRIVQLWRPRHWPYIANVLTTWGNTGERRNR